MAQQREATLLRHFRRVRQYLRERGRESMVRKAWPGKRDWESMVRKARLGEHGQESMAEKAWSGKHGQETGAKRAWSGKHGRESGDAGIKKAFCFHRNYCELERCYC